jgi:hypothetical protein
MPRHFIVTNTGGRVTDADAERILQASRKELVNFCDKHDLAIPTLEYCADGATAKLTDDLIDLADQPPMGEDGVLGEHTEISGQARGSVYVGYELDNGGKVLALDGSEPPRSTTGSAIFFHELTEQLKNPRVNTWKDGPIQAGGQQWASVVDEVADPVEDKFIKQTADDGTEVWLSDYVTPAWSDPEATATSGYDAANVLTAPFTFTGYVEVRNEPGSETPIFPDGYPEHRKKLKEWQWKARCAS